MAEGFYAIPKGSDLLIDANIFVYGLTAKSAECKTLLQRCSSEEITGITLLEVVHEATHVFMGAEARSKGLVTVGDKAAKYLRGHPEQVKLLTDYWFNTQRLLALNILLLPMAESIVMGAQIERAHSGLLTNDSVIVAAMKEYGIVR